MIIHLSSVIGVFCVYSFLLNISVLHSSSVISTLETPEEQINDCKKWEFRCENERCIAKAFLCDGLPDCTDGSDEKYDQCQNITCDNRHFQCHYGACINKTYQCDGIKQCVDGSDELVELCDTATHKPIRSGRATDNRKSCQIPPPSVDKTIKFICADNTSLLCNPVNGLVPHYTAAVMKCNSGYEKAKQDDEEENDEYYCIKGKWRPRIDPCFKICDKLNPVNVDLRCFRDGINIPCNEKTVLLHGTIVRPSCKPTHKYSSDSPPNYLEITCNSDGKWDDTLFSCIPECGRTYTNPKLLIANGSAERFGDSPWHVAIYNHKKVLICGGTIITPYLVVSAAHCFHDEGSSPNIRNIGANNYEVAVGKVTRNYYTKDSNVQKIHKIKKIRFSEKGYFGVSNNFQADIAILVLEEKLNISSTVLPACIDWVALRDGVYPSEDTPGKVVGWGINEFGNYSDVLTTVDLPFLSHQRCVETVPEDFKQFVTFDKFCAGTEKGAVVLQGDSGGGLLFKKNNYYYLQGIVSLKDPLMTGIAAFTDLAEHVGFISKVRSQVDEELNKIAIQVQTTTEIITKTPSTEKFVTKAWQYCEKYAEYRYVKKWQPAMANRAGYWYNTTDCVNVLPLISNGIQAQPKEYPHMAHIGYGKNFSRVQWACAGSLISERFILSAAHCDDSPLGTPQWAMLGDLKLSSRKDDAKPVTYSIIRVYNHPNYTRSSYYHDISLLELNTTVKMSPYVRPACLHTSMTDLLFGSRASITGWGQTGPVEKASDNLLKATVTILNDKQCKISYDGISPLAHGYDSDTMICAGDLIDGNDTCPGDAGGPLQTIKDVCMWKIVGVTSVGSVICGDLETPAVYTRVAYYLSWIESIVWP